MKRKEKKFYKELILVIIVIIIVITAPIINENTNNQITKENVIDNIAKEIQDINIDKEKLNILYLDVGQADSEIVFYKDKVMIIDSGNANDGKKIIDFLKSANISKIDYLIGTHIHEDHIGSMQFLVKEFEIENMYLPYNETNTSIYYKNLLQEVLNKNLEITEVSVGDKIAIDDLECIIMAVDNNEPEDANDASIVMEINYLNYKFLFTGDSTKKVENLRKWNDIDVLKVGHHGSKTSSSEQFLNQIKPEISIISVGKDNNYNLPSDVTIEKLKNIGSKIYRTDEDGTLQMIVDDKGYEIFKINRSFDGD